MSTFNPRQFLLDLYGSAVDAVSAEKCLPAFLPEPPVNGRTLVIGAGKGAAAMARAVEKHWKGDISGLVVTRYEHGIDCQRIEVIEAAHPVPDEAGRKAASRMMEMVQGLTENDLVLCLISGGGSSLLALPAPGITLEQKQAINRALLKSGAAISEMNCVRKHLSAIKGGHLAKLCAPARVVTLCISDVPGDDPAIIASGPTVPDATTCADALRILQRHAIAIPEHVRAALEDGTLETPKPGDACFARTSVHLVATPQHALEAAARTALAAGVSAHILSDEIEGESHVVGRLHGALARAVALRDAPFRKPCVILSGGETTVTVNARGGRGGRATEFLLGCALALQETPGVHVLAADTDGIDGVEDNAGAFVAPDTLARAASLQLKAQEHLDRNDAHGFFEPLGDLLVTGPTYTNVNDFRALLVL